MEKGKVVEPLSGEWFKTVSFGDAIKIISFIGTALVMFTNLKSDVAHESELRRMLETHTNEVVMEMRTAQKDNSARIDQRFAETSQRDRELMNEFKARLDRLDSKLDTVATAIGNLPRR